MLHVSVTHSFAGDGQVVGVVQAIVIHMAPLLLDVMPPVSMVPPAPDALETGLPLPLLVLDAMPPIPLLLDVMSPVPMVPPAPDALETGLPLLPLIAAPAPPVG
jgi:hypothetical protein